MSPADRLRAHLAHLARMAQIRAAIDEAVHVT